MSCSIHQRDVCRTLVSVGIGIAFFVAEPGEAHAQAASDPLAWSAITRECRPWAYNWWLGSAVDKENLAKELQRYREGGLGGIHIIPIYGAKGAEDRYLEYLSPAWMEILGFAVSEGERNDLGVDMTTGTGWCFGGPNIPKEQGGWRMQTKVVEVKPGAALTERFDRRSVQALAAVAANGQRVDLLPRMDDNGRVDWDPAGKAWKVYALIASPGGPAVKRAAPGGAGPMINPFDPAAMARHLERFTAAFAGYQGPRPRSMYHDSFEYGSSWGPQFLDAFARHRGYRLEDRLAAFCGDSGADDEAARVRCDYRETASDLLIEEVFPLWAKWCRERGFLTRNQAHGSPGNLLDLYALADMPETEMFGRGSRDPLQSGFAANFQDGDRNVLISKFAASAAHVMGRKRVAAETGTWMAEHFCETLEEMKCFADLLFCAGVNHTVYHGCCYSPDDAAWPGWLFYASTEMNPRNPIWHDAPALNGYIARCQSILQEGAPDNDVLLYWPVHDLWQNTPGGLIRCTVHDHKWLTDQPLGATARALWTRGYGFDYVSDRQLSALAAGADGVLTAPGGKYQVLLAPPTRLIPADTLKRFVELARQGGTVIFQDRLPEDVPGAADLENRRAAFKKLLAGVEFKSVSATFKEARLGGGRIIAGELEAALSHAGVRRETLVDHSGTMFIRRRHREGRHYFIANQSTELMAGWRSLATDALSAIIMDPLTSRTGTTALRRNPQGQPMVYLRLEPGHSIIVRTLDGAVAKGPEWKWHEPGPIHAKYLQPWEVKFIKGGPELPKPYRADKLESWTANGDPATERFGGTAVYRINIGDAPKDRGPWLLDLGDVRHSACVRLNGRELGTLFMKPYRILVEDLKASGGNELEIEVTNLAANRIRDLDRRKVPWRIFHDINLVNIRYRPFDASPWPVFDSGLLGPVQLLTAKQ